ncbi:salicylate hydroxylase (FAD binding domain-containing protein) [Phlyctema vagabunda]|uniref:Salicylate hydroxylase (FAD binding domain-containing protein) n=1 Tax=Phlyctema vagabunda TaxID=108571 RepID=A0ABR4P4E9_9HELO
MKATKSFQIVVVGAGLGGLGAAIALRKAGHKVIVLEQAQEFIEIGAGVQVPPNAARELVRWGLEAQMEEIASQPDKINYRSWDTGKTYGHTDLWNVRERFGAPYWQVFRPDYHRVLMQAAARCGADIRKASEVKIYLPEEGVVVLVDGSKVSGDLIIAADGVKSIAREAIGVPIEPKETGDTCFRVVIPAEKLRADPELAELSTRPGFEQWLGPDHHVIGYNISKERYFNLLLVIPDDKKMVGYKAPSSATEVKNAFTGWNSTVEKLLAFLPEDVERWRLIDLPPISNWLHPSKKLLLLGDSGHATLPYLAQGAAMAIEDASALGTILSHLSSTDELPRLLESYCKTRMSRVHTIQRGSWTNRFWIHMGKGPMLEMRNEVFGFGDYNGSPNIMGNTLFTNWMYSYDAKKEAENQVLRIFSSKI